MGGSRFANEVVFTRALLELVFTSEENSNVSAPNSSPPNCTSSAAMASCGISTALSGIFAGIRRCGFGRGNAPSEVEKIVLPCMDCDGA